MNLIAIQVVGEGCFALPPFFKPFFIEPIQWKCYGGSCSCVFQREIHFWGNKLEECQRLCETTTAFWATVSNHLKGLDDFKKNLQLLLGNEFTMTEIKAFQDQNGELVRYGGRVKGDEVQRGDQGKLIEKLYRSNYSFLRPSQMFPNMMPQSLSKRFYVRLPKLIEIYWTEITPICRLLIRL
jgi:hypothetical protein